MEISINCLHPITVVNPRYRKDFDHEYGYPPDYYMCVPCGKCARCRTKRSASWHFRTYYEALAAPTFRNGKKEQLNIWFCTFTFRQEFLPDDKNDGLRDRVAPYIRKWRDNWRKRHGRSPRYFCVTDIGSNPVSGDPDDCRLHLHLLIFNPTRADGSRIGLSSVFTDPDLLADPFDYSHQLDWHYGRVDAQFVNGIECIHYVSGYINNRNISRAIANGKLPKKHGKALSEKARHHVAAVFVSNGLGLQFVSSKDFAKLRALKSPVARLGTYTYALPRYYELYYYDDLYIDPDNPFPITRQEQMSADHRIRMLKMREDIERAMPDVYFTVGDRRFHWSSNGLRSYVRGIDKVFGFDKPEAPERSVFFRPSELFGSVEISTGELECSFDAVKLDFLCESFLAQPKRCTYVQQSLFN